MPSSTPSATTSRLSADMPSKEQTPPTQTQQKPSIFKMATGRKLTTILVIVASVALLLLSLVTIAFKGMATAAWQETASQAIEVRAKEEPRQRIRKVVDGIAWVHDGPRDGLGSFYPGFASISAILIFLPSALCTLLSLATILNAFYASSRGPLKTSTAVRAIYYLTYHILTAFTIAAFVGLTVMHFKSPHFDSSDYGILTVHDVLDYYAHEGLYKVWEAGTWEYSSFSRMDLETWACDMHTTFFLLDTRASVAKTCVLETGSRWAMLPMGLAALVLAVLMTMDWIGPGRLMGDRNVRDHQARNDAQVDAQISEGARV